MQSRTAASDRPGPAQSPEGQSSRLDVGKSKAGGGSPRGNHRGVRQTGVAMRTGIEGGVNGLGRQDVVAKSEHRARG